MKTYVTSDMTDEEIDALWTKIRKERWLWTCNGLLMPRDEERFNFRRHGHGDFVMLVSRGSHPFHNDIPVMG